MSNESKGYCELVAKFDEIERDNTEREKEASECSYTSLMKDHRRVSSNIRFDTQDMSLHDQMVYAFELIDKTKDNKTIRYLIANELRVHFATCSKEEFEEYENYL